MPLFSPAQAAASAFIDLTDVQLTSLADGQKLIWDATASKWKNSNSATVTVSTTPPSSPKVGDLWFDIS
jgi:hypothetical protein